MRSEAVNGNLDYILSFCKYVTLAVNLTGVVSVTVESMQFMLSVPP